MRDASVEFREPESEAEELFLTLLQGDGARSAPDVEPLCRERPELADELRALAEEHRRLLALLDALGGGPAPAGGGPRGGPSRYEVRGEVARGGMGAILEVWDAELRRTLAMKVLRAAGEAAPASRLERQRRRSRLLNEAQILAQLEHPGIVPVHEVGLDERGEIYFTMQLVRGRGFEEVVPLARDAAEGWSLTRAVGVLQRVADAVAYAHFRGVLHRDLKPANVMVGAFGEAYVMDWGLAKARGRGEGAAVLRVSAFSASQRDPQAAPEGPWPTPSTSVRTARREASESDPFSPLLTAQGDVVGTPAYMPPEQAAGALEELDERADVYGLGAILYHLLGGAPPYAEELASLAPRARLAHVARTPPAPLGRAARVAPAELVAICERAMARDPSARYASMSALADDLRAYLEGRVVRAHRTGPLVEIVKWGRRHRLAVAALLALVTTLLASTGTFAYLYGTAERRRVAMLLAQADALRRQRALTEQGPARTLSTFYDDFEDGHIDRRFVADGRPDLIEETGGRLVLHAERKRDTRLRLDPVNSKIVGDFELQVDYHLAGFTVPSAPLAERIFGLMLFDVAHAITQITVEAEKASRVTGESGFSYRSRRGDGSWAYTTFADADGRLRLVRSGAGISTYYWRNDGWQELMSDNFTDGPLSFSTWCRNFYDDQPFSVALDDLAFRAAPPSSGAVITDYRDDFSDGVVDARVYFTSNAGVVAELEGGLHLEKLQGRRGEISVSMDGLRWALRGDFSVAVGVDLRRFRAVADGDVVLSFRIRSCDGIPWGQLDVSPIPGREGRVRVRAGDHVEAREVVLDEAPEALRIRRVGTGLLFEYRQGPERWITLRERPPILDAFDMYFQILLVAKTEEQQVVVLDDLEVTSLEER